MNPSSPTLAEFVMQVTRLAEWTETQLADELASRQAIAEHGLAQIQEMRGLLDRVDIIDVRQLRDDPRVREAVDWVAGHGMSAITGENLPEVRQLAVHLHELLSAVLDAIGGQQS